MAPIFDHEETGFIGGQRHASAIDGHLIARIGGIGDRVASAPRLLRYHLLLVGPGLDVDGVTGDERICSLLDGLPRLGFRARVGIAASGRHVVHASLRH